MKTTKEDNNPTIVVYAINNYLLNITKWEWEIILTENPKNFINEAKIFLIKLRCMSSNTSMQ